MTQPIRTTMLILVFAFIVSVVLNGVLVIMMSKNFTGDAVKNLDTVRTACYTLAGAGILTAIYWSLMKMPVSPTNGQFQTDMILALAFSEVASIAGMLLFFLSHRPAEFWPFGIAAIVVDAVFILPRVLQRA